MLIQANRGEDIEFCADRYEKRQRVLREHYEEGAANPSENSGGGFPEEDARESRKTTIQQSRIY